MTDAELEIVHFSRTWSDVREDDDRFHESVVRELGGARSSDRTPPDRPSGSTPS
jgi:hypothetical protein